MSLLSRIASHMTMQHTKTCVVLKKRAYLKRICTIDLIFSIANNTKTNVLTDDFWYFLSQNMFSIICVIADSKEELLEKNPKLIYIISSLVDCRS